VVSALIYAVSFKFVYFDNNLAPSNWLPFITIFWTYLFLNQKLKRKSAILGTISGFAAQLHPVGIVLLPLTLLVQLRRSVNRFRQLIVIMIAFGVWFSPIIIFDHRHDFINLQGILNLPPVTDYPVLFRFLDRFRILLTTITGIINPKLGLIAICLTGYILFLWLISKSSHIRITKSIGPVTLAVYGIIINWLVFSLYRGPVPDYYFIPAMVFFVIITGRAVAHLFDRIRYYPLLSAVILFFIVSNLYIISTFINPYSFAVKSQVVADIAQSSNQPVRVQIISDLGQRFGWQPLFSWYHVAVTFVDSNPDYRIIIPATANPDRKIYGGIGVEAANR
jgi:hypothetical protein